MDLKKVLLVVVAAMFLATPAIAGNIPEFDAVGCDATNYFAVANEVPYGLVIDNNIDFYGDKVNCFSDFTGGAASVDAATAALVSQLFYYPLWKEAFVQYAGQAQPDPCFPGYFSHVTDAGNGSQYNWWIILQMKPESDLDLNIYDCVTKSDATLIYGDKAIWVAAQQTGRIQTTWGDRFFVRYANPRVTVVAYPGPYAAPGFLQPMTMSARKQPSLYTTRLSNALYTSKALFDESIVIVMPDDGCLLDCGDEAWELRGGDQIRVTIDVPGTNTADIYYGKDNVILKYIGVGTHWFKALADCCGNGTL
jgi:hypothetical protein